MVSSEELACSIAIERDDILSFIDAHYNYISEKLINIDHAKLIYSQFRLKLRIMPFCYHDISLNSNSIANRINRNNYPRK